MTAPASHFEITDLLHGSCGDCRKCAEDATIYASAQGTTGGTSSVERRDPSNDRLVAEHRATVRRIPEDRIVIMHDPKDSALNAFRELITLYTRGQSVTERAIADEMRAAFTEYSLSLSLSPDLPTS